MAQFRYRAARIDGTVVEDWADGDSEQAVRTQIEGRGWLVLNLDAPGSARKATGLSQSGGSRWMRGRLSLREQLVFNQEFLALLKAGLPMLKLFELLAERAGSHPEFRAALQGVRNEIRGGASISQAMAQYPAHFPELFRASIQSGEQTGNLVDVLQRYLTYLKLVLGVRDKVTKALAYPVFLIVVGLGVVGFLLVYVMPTFSEIYGQNHTSLPAPTQILLTAVDLLKRWFVWLLAGAAVLIVLFYRWMRTPGGRVRLDRMSLSLPLLGDILLKNQIVRMTRTLSTVLASGMPLLTALQITGGAITNRVIAQAITSATERIKNGTSLAASLKSENILPPVTLEMIEVGETTGSLETMLQDVAEFHEGELDLRLTQLTTWIEPALLLVMGVIVGGIVIVMYLPVFQIAGTV